MTATAERRPVQDQIDEIRAELRNMATEISFTMRYCRAAAQALGAIAQVEVIDSERALWLERKNAGAEEDTQPARRLHPVE